MSLCLITPRLPPSIDGVGDYCRQLWQHCQMSGIDSGGAWRFLVSDGFAETKVFWPEIQVDQLETNRDSILNQLEKLDCDAILLQYVGYGFDPEGAPFALVDALTAWKEQNQSRRLIIMFHETWSSGAIWQRTFWQMNNQKRCIKKLLDAASTVVTSMEANAQSLRVLGSITPISIIPIGSSFRVPSHTEKNWRQLLIFGKEYPRLRAIKHHHRLIKTLIAEHLIDTIVLAGQNTKGELPEMGELLQVWSPDLRIVKEFNFAPLVIPDAVTRCGLSIMHTQSTNLLKSTSFQLAIQLGQVPITLWERPADPPFERNEHYLAYKENEIAELKSTLTNKETLMTISEKCFALSEEYLNWESLAKKWSAILKIESRAR